MKKVLREYLALAEVLVVVGCLFFLPLVSLIAYRVYSDQFTIGSTLLQALGCLFLLAVGIYLSALTEKIGEVLFPNKFLRVLVDIAVWALIFACFFSFWTPLVPALVLAAISTAVWGVISFLTMKRYEILLENESRTARVE